MRFNVGLIVALLTASGAALACAQATASIQGAWSVTEVVVTGANAETIKSPQPGLYIFTKQYFSIMRVNGTAPRKDFGSPHDAVNLTDAEKIESYEVWKPFSANSGTYQVNGTTLTLRPLVAKNPSVMAWPPYTRDFRIQGNTLTLIEKSAPGQPASETRIRFTRVE